jgi:hypothetical protein
MSNSAAHDALLHGQAVTVKEADSSINRQATTLLCRPCLYNPQLMALARTAI